MDSKDGPVATFVRHRIQVTGKAQNEIAREAGFDKPNIITLIKQGKTRLPLAKIGPMAVALETDPVALVKLWVSTYYPDTFETMEPLFESSFSSEEVVMVKAWRQFVGTPYLAALTEEQKRRLNAFLASLRSPEPMH